MLSALTIIHIYYKHMGDTWPYEDPSGVLKCHVLLSLDITLSCNTLLQNVRQYSHVELISRVAPLQGIQPMAYKRHRYLFVVIL